MKALKSFILILLFVLSVIGLTNSEIHAQEKIEPDRKPIILLQEPIAYGDSYKTIWQSGQWNPNFILYHDGLVIFKKETNQYELFSVKLSPDELKRLLDEFKIGNEFMELEYAIFASPYLDQPGHTIKYWQGLKMKQVSVFGAIRENAEDRKHAPKAFLQLFDQMISFDHKNARLWEPQKVEIKVWPYINAEGEPVPWPKGWPDLNHKTTKMSKNGYSYTLYLDGDKKAELEQMLSGLKEKQAILMNGKQWVIYPQRYCLPSEELWGNE